MRRFALPLSLIAVLFVGLVTALGRSTAAQEPTPAAMSRHPLIGTWLLDTNVEFQTDIPQLATFTADGAYIGVDAAGYPYLGVWEASGERAAMFTVVAPWVEDEAFGGTVKVRGAVDVDNTGHAFTAQVTDEYVEADGTSPGEYGPGTMIGTRITVEAMGTPVGSMEDLYGEAGAAAETPMP